MKNIEQKVFDASDKWDIWAKKLCISLGLLVAAFLMVMAWIFHLNWEREISFGQAFGISMLFVIFDYLINTFVTRYSINKNLFSQAQLATLSIVFGVIFIFVVGLFLRADIYRKRYKTTFKKELENAFKSEFSISTILGLIFVAIGSGLVLSFD